MAAYDQGELIKNEYVESLRLTLNTIITARVKGMGTSSFSSYSAPATVSSSVTESAGSTANSSPEANALRVIQHLLKSGYMKPAGTTAQQNAATALKNQTYPDVGTLMYALTNAFTVVNYWNSGTNGSSTGCNGACTGYCDGSCGGGTTKGTGNGSSNVCSSCSSICISGCSSCTSCTGACTGGCSSHCFGTCSGGCRGTCRGGCWNACSGGCGNSCTGRVNTR